MRSTIPFEVDTLLGVIKRLPDPRDAPEGYVVRLPVYPDVGECLPFAVEQVRPFDAEVYVHQFKRITINKDGVNVPAWELLV